MRWRRSIVGSLIGLAFGVVYFFFALAASGAGHGTFIFFAAISPGVFGVIAFPVLGFLGGDLRPFISKVFFVSLLVIHYTLVINTLRAPWIRDRAYIEKTWAFSPWLIVLPAALYLSANVFIWVLFLYELAKGRGRGTNH